MRSGLGAYIGVAAAAALAGACLAGGPLYVSSAASEAVQVGLERTCLTDAGLVVRLARNPSGPEADLVEAASHVAHTEPALVTETVPQVVTRAGSSTPIRSVLLDRTGQYDALGLSPLGAGEASSPDWEQPISGLGPGVEVEGSIANAQRFDSAGQPILTPSTPYSLTIRDLYQGIPVNPEPSYWCGLRTLLRPTAQGDPPPPMLIVDPATFHALPRLNLSRIVEVRPDPKGLTRVEAKKLSAGLDAIATTYSNTATGAPSGGAVGIPIRGSRFRNGLPAIITYAETLSDVVARTVAPVRIAGLAAAALLLITAGAMLARTRASELRLRVLRGVSPVAVGARVAGAAAPAIVVGVLAGFALALVGVITLGPTPELEPEPVRAALLACVAGAVAGTLLVAAVIAAISARSVDARPRHHWVRWVPWELAVVALAIASYRRLDRAGGVRLVGAEAEGGDLLAQAFPLLALGAALVVFARPLRWVLARTRERTAAAEPAPGGRSPALGRCGHHRARDSRSRPRDRVSDAFVDAHRQRERDAAREGRHLPRLRPRRQREQRERSRAAGFARVTVDGGASGADERRRDPGRSPRHRPLDVRERDRAAAFGSRRGSARGPAPRPVERHLPAGCDRRARRPR